MATSLIVETPGEGWYIDGEYLSDYGTLIEPRDGWDDTPTIRGDNSTALGVDGVGFREKLYDAGKKVITIGIHGAVDRGEDGWGVPATGSAQRTLYEANLDALIRLTGWRHRPLTVQRVYPNGLRLQALCEVTAPITPATTGNTYGQIQLELTVLGAFWEDVDALTTALPYVVGGGNAQTVEVYSLAGQTASCGDAEVTITGPCTSIAMTDTLTGRGFSYGALIAGDVLVVQPDGAFAATKNGTSVITSVDFEGANLLKISPAPQVTEGPRVDVTAVGAASGFSVTVTAKRKYLR